MFVYEKQFILKQTLLQTNAAGTDVFHVVFVGNLIIFNYVKNYKYYILENKRNLRAYHILAKYFY